MSKQLTNTYSLLRDTSRISISNFDQQLPHYDVKLTSMLGCLQGIESMTFINMWLTLLSTSSLQTVECSVTMLLAIQNLTPATLSVTALS
jgi:hypothetical protein